MEFWIDIHFPNAHIWHKMKEEPTTETHLSVTRVVKDTSWSHARLSPALNPLEPGQASGTLHLLLQLTTDFSLERDPKNW